jgi:hypothetical protein
MLRFSFLILPPMTYNPYAGKASDTSFDGIEFVRPTHIRLGILGEFDGRDGACFWRAITARRNTEEPEERNFPAMRAMSQQIALSERVSEYPLDHVRFQYFMHERSHLTTASTVIIALINKKHPAAMRLSCTCADTNRARL